MEGGTVIDYPWYILGRRAGLLSHAKPIQARLSGDSANIDTVYRESPRCRDRPGGVRQPRFCLAVSTNPLSLHPVFRQGQCT